MSLLSIVIVIVCFGLLVYAVNRWLPIDPQFKQFLIAIVLICIVIWILTGVFGGSFPDVRIGG